MFIFAVFLTQQMQGLELISGVLAFFYRHSEMRCVAGLWRLIMINAGRFYALAEPPPPAIGDASTDWGQVVARRFGILPGSPATT